MHSSIPRTVPCPAPGPGSHSPDAAGHRMSCGFVRAHNLPESAALPPDPALAAQNISVLARCPGPSQQG